MTPSTRGTVLITGGAKRIGRAIGLSLARLGFNIGLHYHRSGGEAERLAAAIRRLGVECRLFPADLSRAGEAQGLIPAVLQEFPDLSVLINNASIFKPDSLVKPDLELWDRIFAANLKAPYILTGCFAKHCRQGNIINILDTKITKNQTSFPAYLLSKKCLYELTKLAATALAPRIRVNAVAPGLILPPEGRDAAYLARLSRTVPLKRRGYPADICRAVEFILKNDFLTGQVLFVDGGQHLL